ncbi:MAG: hypothetical protein K2H26_07060, partial [Ruminococcus sp.]|nr:hypothetical protein [Ruminococcus sp.]
MLKKFLASIMATLMLTSINPVMTIIESKGANNVPSDLQTDVIIDAYTGEIKLKSIGAGNAGITSIMLNLISDKEIVFNLSESIKTDIYNVTNSQKDGKTDMNITIHKHTNKTPLIVTDTII